MTRNQIGRLCATVFTIVVIASACGGEDDRFRALYCQNPVTNEVYDLSRSYADECRNGDVQIESEEYLEYEYAQRITRDRKYTLLGMELEDCASVDHYEFLLAGGPRTQDDGSVYTFDCTTGIDAYLFTEASDEHSWEATPNVELERDGLYPVELFDDLPFDYQHPRYSDALTLSDISTGTVACLNYHKSAESQTIEINVTAKGVHVDLTFDEATEMVGKEVNPETGEWEWTVVGYEDGPLLEAEVLGVQVDYIIYNDDEDDPYDFLNGEAAQLGLMPFPSGNWARSHVMAGACAD